MEQELLKTGYFIDNEQFHKMINIIRNPEIDERMEEHHILPKCVGGSNDKENLVMQEHQSDGEERAHDRALRGV